MAEGRVRLEWNQTSELLCVLYNAYRDPKKRSKPYTAAEFHPLERGKKKEGSGIPLSKSGVGILKQVFVKDEGARQS